MRAGPSCRLGVADSADSCRRSSHSHAHVSLPAEQCETWFSDEQEPMSASRWSPISLHRTHHVSCHFPHLLPKWSPPVGRGCRAPCWGRTLTAARGPRRRSLRLNPAQFAGPASCRNFTVVPVAAKRATATLGRLAGHQAEGATYWCSRVVLPDATPAAWRTFGPIPRRARHLDPVISSGARPTNSFHVLPHQLIDGQTALLATVVGGVLDGAWTFDPSRSSVSLKTRNMWEPVKINAVFGDLRGELAVVAGSVAARIAVGGLHRYEECQAGQVPEIRRLSRSRHVPALPLP